MTSSVFYQIRNLRSTAPLSLMPLLLAIFDPKEVVEPFPVAPFCGTALTRIPQETEPAPYRTR